MITSLKKLSALSTPVSGAAAAGNHRVEPPTTLPVVAVPPPTNGVCYDQYELAEILNVRAATISDWISRGRCGVKLETCRAPRGRIFPQAFARFFGHVNRCEVVINEQ